MKYISLVRMMSHYGEWVHTEHSLCPVEFSVVNNQISLRPDFTPFNITASTKDIDDTQQVVNNCKPNYNLTRIYGMEDHEFEFPPIIEVEWLKDKLNLSDEHAKVLNQLSYLFIYRLLMWKSYKTAFDWSKHLEAVDVILDVENIEDTPEIITTDSMPKGDLPKYRTYSIVLIYQRSIGNLLTKCQEMSTGFKEIYYHIPVMLSMFVVDLQRDKLKNWSKQDRLNTENKLQQQINAWEHYGRNASQIYTYGMCSNVTVKDIDFATFIFSIMHEKLHELNTNIGLISYYDYKKYNGPETINASVRLCNMKIDWDDEMNRAEREKKEQEENDDMMDDEPSDEE